MGEDCADMDVCSQDEDDVEGDANLGVPMECDAQAEEPGAFTGDNLIEAPNKVPTLSQIVFVTPDFCAKLARSRIFILSALSVFEVEFVYHPVSTVSYIVNDMQPLRFT